MVTQEGAHIVFNSLTPHEIVLVQHGDSHLVSPLLVRSVVSVYKGQLVCFLLFSFSSWSNVSLCVFFQNVYTDLSVTINYRCKITKLLQRPQE